MRQLNLLLLTGMLTLSACAGSVIQNVETSFSGSSLTSQRVEQAIDDGMTEGGWKVRMRRPGRIVSELNVRQQQAVIEIAFDNAQYTITYVSSKNLDGSTSGRNINPIYNTWVQKLDADIQRMLVREN